MILAPSGGVGVLHWVLDQSESRARPMRMLYECHRNGLDYCSSNGNCAVKGLKPPAVAMVPKKYCTITSKTCRHSVTILQYNATV